MEKKKTTILNSSLKLFNQHGFSNVTIRMIAKDIGISSGNLNYHYKNRTEILEALYFEMAEILDRRIDDTASKHYDINILYTGMLESMSIMYRYRFIWSDIYFLQNESQKIKNNLRFTYQKNIETWQFIIQNLVENKFLEANILLRPNNLFANRMVDFSNTWIFAASLNKNGLNKSTLIRQKAEYLLSNFYPFLTETGIKQFQSLKLP